MSRETKKLTDIVLCNSDTWNTRMGWETINYLNTSNITKDKVENITVYNVSEDKAPSRARRIVKNGDIVYSTVRPNQCHYGVLKEIPENLLVSTAFSVLRSKFPDTFNTTYIYYLLTQENITQYLHGIAENNTSAYPSLKPHDILNLEFEFPHLLEQTNVVEFISSIDRKIELNQRMNETLEETAKAIFKSWFVDFDPVRAKMEGRPTGLADDISALFPDELVDSEIGEIPKGWEICELSDLAEVTMGQSPPGDTYNEEELGLPFYQGSTDFGFRFPSIRKFCSDPRRLAEIDDVLLSVRAPVGDLNRAKNKCCIGRGVASIRSKSSHSSWIFYRCSFLKGIFDNFDSEGTVFGSINGRDLKAIKSVLPNKSILDALETIASPIDQSIRVKSEEIETLSELRDTLLPKLISGELPIPDAEKFLKEAGV